MFSALAVFPVMRYINARYLLPLLTFSVTAGYYELAVVHFIITDCCV